MFVRIEETHPVSSAMPMTMTMGMAMACLMPTSIMKELKLSTKAIYTLAVGLRRATVTLAPCDEDETENMTMHVPCTIFQELLLVGGRRFNIWRKGKTIYLGPVIGVLMNDTSIERLVLGNPQLGVQKLVQANVVGHSLLYFFTCQAIRWNENKMQGYYFCEDENIWKRRWLPIPNVIYHRGVGFTHEQKPFVNHMIETFRAHSDIQLINNPSSFGKWETMQALSDDESMRSFLPETCVYRSPDDVLQMLDKHHYVFLKSFWGSHGREVMAIKRKNSQFILTQYRNGFQTIRVRNMEELNQYVLPFVERGKFIVQEGIHLYQFHGRPFDMRVQLNKDRNGQWIAITNQARISDAKSPITNYSLGARLMNYHDLYEEEKSVLPADGRVRETAILIAKSLEKKFGDLGEVGIDLAIDELGKIWFIEANAKPEKTPVAGLEDTEGISPQFSAILEYAEYLCSGSTTSTTSQS